MNREELIDMAEKAGMDTPKGFGHVYTANPMDLERCATVCEARASAVAPGALGSRAEQFAEAIACAEEIRELASTARIVIGKPHK